MRSLPDLREVLTFNGRVSWPFFVLAAIVIVALVLRLHGINWDGGHGYHPDERDIYFRSECMYRALTNDPNAATCGYLVDNPDTKLGLGGLLYLFDADRSPLNPHWFPLGSILIYALVFVRSVMEPFTDMGGLDMRYAGRTLSALADVGSVLMVFVLGRRLYGRNVGLLAAGLTALAVVHVQHSHFYRPETFTVLLTLASIWATFRMVEKRRLKDSVLLGLILGLALAPKVNVLPLLAPLALGYGYRILDEAEGRWDEISLQMLQKIAGHAALCGAVALGMFFLTTPYAFIDIEAFVGDIMAQTRMARNAGLLPFTVQYVDTPPFLYQMQQTILWGLGLPLGVVAWLSIPFTAILMAFDRRHFRADFILLIWMIPSLLFLESFEVRFLRYLFPLMPVMILLASRMMLWYIQRTGVSARRFAELAREATAALGRRGFAPKPSLRIVLLLLAAALPVFVFASTAFYSLAFQKVYADEHPATRAAEWFKAEVPEGSGLVFDNHWDEFLPGLHGYDAWQFPLYHGGDTQEKMLELAERLSRADYLIFYSHRPYASASRDPERFPYSNNYYRLLFSGDLGYRLHREFVTHPSLGGVTFRHDALGSSGLHQVSPEIPSYDAAFTLEFGYTDDNVSGYDHPRVLVFRNALWLSESELIGMIAPEVRPLPAKSATALMLMPDALEKQQNGGTFSEIVDRDGWTNRAPVIAWLLVVELIYLVSLPLSVFVMRSLPDRGILLGRILGLLLVCWIAWLTVSLGWAGFSRGTVYAGIGVVAAISGGVFWIRRREMWEFVKSHWRLLAFSEALFLAAFLAFVAVRYFNPDLWHPYRGGEKPMELAYFTAVFRSTSMPPYDPWFAGGYLNYYYWGYFVVACVNRIAAIVPTTAFNLAVPMFFALTLTGAFSLGYNVAAGVRRSASRRTGGLWTMAGSPSANGKLLPPVFCGLAAALFTAVIANIDGIIQIVQGAWGVLVQNQAWPGFDFWRSARMIPPLDRFEPSPLAFWLPDFLPEAPSTSWHITEFPFFTFLFADLHAHMMVIPFTILTLGLGLALVAGLRRGSAVWTATASAALAVALGSLWAINSWDYPSYAILTLGMLGVASLFTRNTARKKFLLFAVLSVSVLAVSLLSFWPFHQSYETFNSGLNASIWRTPVDRFSAIYGLFFFIAVTFLIMRYRRDLAALVWSEIREEELPRGMGRLKVIVAAAIVAGIAFAALGYWNIVLLTAFLILVLAAGWRVLQSPQPSRPYEMAVLAMLAMAALVAIGVDLVTVEGDIGRMNTQFKYYLEIWVFMAIASAYMLWRLVPARLQIPRLKGPVALWALALMLLIGSSLIYTALGTRDRLDDRFLELPPTLDGAAYMVDAQHWERDEIFPLRHDYEAIRWLQDNVEGSPVVLEAHMEQYRWGGRIANYTGLPTVLGWPWHQIQQRSNYGGLIDERADHVRLAYETTDVEMAVEIMRRYGVSYAVVGDLERLNYGEAGLGKFDDMAESGLMSRVYANEKTAIFRFELP